MPVTEIMDRRTTAGAAGLAAGSALGAGAAATGTGGKRFNYATMQYESDRQTGDDEDTSPSFAGNGTQEKDSPEKEAGNAKNPKIKEMKEKKKQTQAKLSNLGHDQANIVIDSLFLPFETTLNAIGNAAKALEGVGETNQATNLLIALCTIGRDLTVGLAKDLLFGYPKKGHARQPGLVQMMMAGLAKGMEKGQTRGQLAQINQQINELSEEDKERFAKRFAERGNKFRKEVSPEDRDEVMNTAGQVAPDGVKAIRSLIAEAQGRESQRQMENEARMAGGVMNIQELQDVNTVVSSPITVAPPNTSDVGSGRRL